MKRIIRIQAIFFPTIASAAAWLMISTIILQTVAFHVFPLFTKHSISLVQVLGVAVLAIAVIIAGQLNQKLPKQNLPWLLLTPVSKKMLPIHLAILRSEAIAIPLLATLCGSWVASIFSGAGATAFLAIDLYRSAWHILREFPSELTRWVFLVAFINTVGSILLSGTSHESSILTHWWKIFRGKLETSRTSALLLIGVAAAALPLLANELSIPILIFTVTLSPLITPFPWKQELGFPRSIYRRALYGALVLSLIEMTVFSGKAISMLRGTPQQQGEMLILFGKWVPQISANSLLQLMETPLDGHGANKVTDLYLNRFHQGHKLDRRSTKNPDFAKVIGVQKRVRSVLAMYEMYDPKTLDRQDLQVLLTALQGTDVFADETYFAEKFKDIPLTEEEMSDIFVAGSLAELKVALIRARYDRKARYAIDILDHLQEWPSKFARHGIDTISIILGRRITMDDWYRYRRGERFDLNVAKIDCSTVDRDIAAANVCFRKNQGTNQPFNLESQGWVEDPFKKSEAGMLWY